MSIPNIELPEIQGPTVVIKNRTTRGIVANTVILSQVVGILVIAMMEYKIFLDLTTAWLWVPLGGLLFAFVANPLLMLDGYKEPLSVVLSALHLLFYIYVIRPESLRNALVVFFIYTLIVLVFDLPRRIEIS